MIRKLKVLGLALGAVFALSATMASGASAVDIFTVENGGVNTAVLTGESANNLFKITGAGFEIKCGVSRFAGTVTNGASTATIFPTYYQTTPGTKCPTTLGNALVKMNGCDYDLTGSTTGSDGGSADATVSITCTSPNVIEIQGPLGCTVSIPQQTPTSGGVTYANEGAGATRAVTVTATSTGITYTATNACTLVGINTHGNDADYTGTVTVKGFVDNGQGSAPDEFLEGAQKGVFFSES